MSDEWKTYRVRVETTGIEEYVTEAYGEDEARQAFYDGDLRVPDLSENLGGEVVSVVEVTE